MSLLNAPKACKSCGAPIIWVAMQGTGKRMPIDAETLEQRVVLDGTRKHGAVRTCGVSHFATCPNAGKHRKDRSND